MRTSGRQRLGFAFRFDVDVVEEPERDVMTAEVATYAFRLLDANDEELLAYHWHPRGVSPVVHPRLHIPTGHVTISDIVRFLISEVGVEPRRADWLDVLAAAGV